MITINVILAGKTYILPNKDVESKNLRLNIIRKGIEHLFKDVVNNFPVNIILATWDEDNLSLSYESETIDKNTIRNILYAKHGEAFS
jgi:hypothetical protein